MQIPEDFIYYTIYKITNILNNKYYIGKHQTKNLDDGYFGSGKLIQRAIKKYGIENFTKEILFIFDNEVEMNLMEERYVITDPKLSYNLCPGGKGGFGYVNNNKLNNNKTYTQMVEAGKKAYLKSDPIKLLIRNKRNSQRLVEWHKQGKLSTFYFGSNNPHCKKAYSKDVIEKKKIKYLQMDHQKGQRNSQFGSFWITNDQISMKWSKDQGDIPLGFRKGRKMKL